MQKIRLPSKDEIEDLKIEFSSFTVTELRGIALAYLPNLDPAWQISEVEEFMQQLFTDQVKLKSFHDADYLAIWHRDNAYLALQPSR